ncbi:MAG: helix-turn-helix domain-containing protein [Coriobacteriales bacterium]|nr:helix-turn-helix domain-containing protein [Coriobacteriales bacterium]
MRAIKAGGWAAHQDETAHDMPADGHNTILSGMPDILTLEQTAEVLQIGITTARGMCRQHQIPAFKVGQQWRVPRAWLCEFIQGGGNG